MENNSNTLTVIGVGALALVAVFVIGNLLMSNNRDEWRRHDDRYHSRHDADVDVRIRPPAYRQPRQQPRTTYPHHYPSYHNNDRFWTGYREGYRNRSCRMSYCPIYSGGYRAGQYDYRRGTPHYYNDYCPSTFRVRVPGFRLDIR
jgi:hypothetical protein